MTQLDQFTLTAVPLELYFNDTQLGWATGFIWLKNEIHYLVSNWHVFSAQDFFTLKNLDEKNGGRPNRIVARFNIHGQFWKQEWHIALRDPDDKPLWLVHPHRRVDIALMPLVFDKATQVVTLYPLNVLSRHELKVEIGMEVFILGFPFKITPPAFPIWKRGSIASEPQLVRLSDGYMHVDTASRPGMSGSPVVLRSWGTHMVHGDGAMVTDGKARTKFLGVYSGRVPVDHPVEAQIGLVWDASFIDEIIAINKRDT